MYSGRLSTGFWIPLRIGGLASAGRDVGSPRVLHRFVKSYVVSRTPQRSWETRPRPLSHFKQVSRRLGEAMVSQGNAATMRLALSTGQKAFFPWHPSASCLALLLSRWDWLAILPPGHRAPRR